jgi:hypothetical protein
MYTLSGHNPVFFECHAAASRNRRGSANAATNDGLFKMVLMMYLQKGSFRVPREFLNALRTRGITPGYPH